jgi:hypothetical protein
MSYSINRWNGTSLKTVADGTVDTSYDIKLIGKSYAGYGQAQNENFVHQLSSSQWWWARDVYRQFAAGLGGGASTDGRHTEFKSSLSPGKGHAGGRSR